MKLLALITSIMILSACNEVDVGEEIRSECLVSYYCETVGTMLICQPMIEEDGDGEGLNLSELITEAGDG